MIGSSLSDTHTHTHTKLKNTSGHVSKDRSPIEDEIAGLMAACNLSIKVIQ